VNAVIREAFRYTAVSGCALVVDIGILWILVSYFSWWYLAAASTSYFVGLVVGYALSIRVVFKYRRLKDPRVEFVSFAAIGAIGLALNGAIIAFAVGCLGIHYLVAKCGAAAFTFFWGFLARRQLLFVPRTLV
jgi:putative flippase GtrA